MQPISHIRIRQEGVRLLVNLGTQYLILGKPWHGTSLVRLGEHSAILGEPWHRQHSLRHLIRLVRAHEKATGEAFFLYFCAPNSFSELLTNVHQDV